MLPPEILKPPRKRSMICTSSPSVVMFRRTILRSSLCQLIVLKNHWIFLNERLRGDAKVLRMGNDPELDPLHGHPRFNDLPRKLDHRLAALPAIAGQLRADQESIAVLPFRVLGPAEKIQATSIWVLA